MSILYISNYKITSNKKINQSETNKCLKAQANNNIKKIARSIINIIIIIFRILLALNNSHNKYLRESKIMLEILSSKKKPQCVIYHDKTCVHFPIYSLPSISNFFPI